MTETRADIVVAGHICLDIIPSLAGVANVAGRGGEIFLPGKLIKVGPAVISTGGAVPNTGLALHRLGLATQLMGKLGDDLLGRAVLDILKSHDAALASNMIIAPGEKTSYTVVISPPGADRMFLHCPGTNDTFAAADMPFDRINGARIFHFGYPPLMHSMYADAGLGLARMLHQANQLGLAVSLDMSLPDPDSDAGHANWQTILARVLPQVDFFLPSLDETLMMLDPDAFASMESAGGAAGLASQAEAPMLRQLSDRLLDMGAAVVGLKLGDKGLYLRTTSDTARLAAIKGRLALNASQWQRRELLIPCFKVDAVGTTGAGDCTIAGFLAALLHGSSPEQALRTAVAVGACSVERADANSGVPPWDILQQRIAAGWPQQPTLPLPAWQWNEAEHLWTSPDDAPAA